MAKDKKRKNKKIKHSSTVDKVVMGAIIGTAIGSALGMTLAPKKGKETREYLKSKTEDLHEIGQLGKETATGFLNIAKRLIFGKKKKPAQEKRPEGLKKIPTETEVIPHKHVDRD